MNDRIILIGKTTISPEEHDALHLIGYAIAACGRELHTTPTVGAPAAVAAGYKAAGADPHMHTRQLAQVEGATICVLDRDLVNKLNKAKPNWDEEDWTLLETPDDVITFASMLAGWLEATDRSLKAGDG